MRLNSKVAYLIIHVGFFRPQYTYSVYWLMVSIRHLFVFSLPHHYTLSSLFFSVSPQCKPQCGAIYAFHRYKLNKQLWVLLHSLADPKALSVCRYPRFVCAKA